MTSSDSHAELFVDLTRNRNSGDHSPVLNSGNGILFQRNPRFDFLVFNGLDIKNSVMRCEYLFQFYPMNNAQKLRSVALHLEGEVRSWFLAYLKYNSTVYWSQFV